MKHSLQQDVKHIVSNRHSKWHNPNQGKDTTRGGESASLRTRWSNEESQKAHLASAQRSARGMDSSAATENGVGDEGSVSSTKERAVASPAEADQGKLASDVCRTRPPLAPGNDESSAGSRTRGGKREATSTKTSGFVLSSKTSTRLPGEGESLATSRTSRLGEKAAVASSKTGPSGRSTVSHDVHSIDHDGAGNNCDKHVEDSDVDDEVAIDIDDELPNDGVEVAQHDDEGASDDNVVSLDHDAGGTYDAVGIVESGGNYENEGLHVFDGFGNEFDEVGNITLDVQYQDNDVQCEDYDNKENNDAGIDVKADRAAQKDDETLSDTGCDQEVASAANSK